MSLDDIRKEIDSIDDQLITLFVKRMAALQNVTETKIRENLPVIDFGREKQVIGRALKVVPPDIAGYASSFFSFLMDLSKSRQRELIRASTANENAFIRTIRQTRAQIAAPRLSVQGIRGSYSTFASERMYPDGKVHYEDKWEYVMEDVINDSADYGIIPIENSEAGSVPEILNLLLRHNLFIVKALPLPVNHCLLGVRGANFRDVKYVYSHPHAFPQCTRFFAENHRLQKIPYLNTAMAAEMVSREGNREKAAVASRECAHLYGLDILRESIQDCDSNCTRFISVSKKLEIPQDANKISIIFTLPHVTGSLCRFLSRFSLSGYNITKIESRPAVGKMFEYFFYLDFIGSVLSEKTQSLLSAISDEVPQFYFLGNYFEQ